MRRGWRWARAGFLIAGAIGFPTFFLFFSYRFFDPLHFAMRKCSPALLMGGCFASLPTIAPDSVERWRRWVQAC